MNYVERFEKLGFGMFVHFGLYSVVGKGEWYLRCNPKADKEKYDSLINKFKIKKNWAKTLVKTAKSAGCKYVTITTRHHDGFSLFDTCGLSDFDVMHSPTNRDLMKEFVDECNKNGIVPFFYHTLMDWHHPDYYTNFPKYVEYLISSVEILCRNYGKIGGFWFDGMWDKPNDDWQEDRLYGTIRKYQPEAMIINNTGLSAQGKVGHKEIDSVTFERGKPTFVDNSDKHRAGEMCQVLNDHWGYAKEDCNFKSVAKIISDLVDCRRFNCNFLINTGLKGNGDVNEMDRCMLGEVGKWIKKNKNFIYDVKSTDLKVDNAFILKAGDYYYAVIKDVPMSANVNVAIGGATTDVTIYSDKVKNAVWLDDGSVVDTVKENGTTKFATKPFLYGSSFALRVAKFKIK